MSRSYGNYDAQMPMKTFNGQPRYANGSDVSMLDDKIAHLEKCIQDAHPTSSCGKCPSMTECAKLQGEAHVRCMDSHAQCNARCQ